MLEHKDVRKGQNGSMLAATAGLCVILSLGGVCFLMLSSASVTDEHQVFLEEKALAAAESGLLLGTHWLRRQSAMPVSSIYNIFNGPISINGLSVYGHVIRDAGRVIVFAQAGDKNTNYIKSLQWTVRERTAGDMGTFIRTLNGEDLNNFTMDGPFHANEPIILSSVSNPGAGGAQVVFKNGPVSVYNQTALTNFDKKDPYNTGDFGNYGWGAYNDYNFGVYDRNLTQGSENGGKIDGYFTDIYRHSQDSLVMAPGQAPDIVLAGGDSDASNDEDAAHRPTLIFNADGSAVFYKWAKSGANWTVSKDSLPAAAIDGRLLRVPDNDVNIMGTVNGQISVMTDSGHSIFVTGDLVYRGFSPLDDSFYGNWDTTGNYGLGSPDDNANIIGLISGKDLHFSADWIDPRDGGSANAKDVEPWFDASGNLYYMSQLIAANPGGNTMWLEKKGQGNTSVSLQDYNYKLRYIGTRCMDEWYSYTAGGTDANTQLRFYNDSRLQKGLIAPKLPLVRSGSDDLFSLIVGEWREDNITKWGVPEQ